ncbi:MAG: phasin family protein [Calothrix sp. MO_167.B12]|nr:phasin family protein [Calothrix sp. MO_167.B12]
MPGFGDIVKKTFYLGVGLAAYAGEQAGSKVAELRSQVQKLADEMVERGEMNTEEARRFVEDMMKQAQQQSQTNVEAEKKPAAEPRRIEILEDDEQFTEKVSSPDNVDSLRQQVLNLQEELKRLQRDK